MYAGAASAATDQGSAGPAGSGPNPADAAGDATSGAEEDVVEAEIIDEEKGEK